MLDSSILVQIKHFSHSYLERSQIDLGTWFLTSAFTIKLIQALFRILWILFILLGDAHMHVHFTCSFVMTHDEESACDAGDLGLISGLGRSPGEGNGNPLQYSWWENPHGQRSLEGYSPWGHKEPDMTDRLSRAQASVWPFVLAALGFMRELGNTFWVMIQGVKNSLCNYYKPMTGSVYPATAQSTLKFHHLSFRGWLSCQVKSWWAVNAQFVLVSGPL